MARFFRVLIKALLLLVVVVVLLFGVGAWYWRDIPAEELEARYTSPASRFMNVDGVRIHYRDEGQGPAVVLIHAHFANLIGWDPWVDALKDSYRVIRFDMASHGLTGPDPTGDYSVGRTVEILERFVDALKLDTFVIGGTSLGGTMAINYTGRNPDRISRLILLSPGILEGRSRADDQGRTRLPAAAQILRYITPRAMPAGMLRTGFGDPDKVTDELIDRWHDMWRREDQRPAMLARMNQYVSKDLDQVVGRVSVPTLVLWGEANPQAEVEQAYELLEMLSGTDEVTLIIYPGVGHMAVQEAGDESGRDVLAFLDGTLEPAS